MQATSRQYRTELMFVDGTSSVSGLVEYGVDYFGHDIKRIEGEIISYPATCLWLCQTTPGCSYWTWTANKNCYLKDVAALENRRSGMDTIFYVSGSSDITSSTGEDCFQVNTEYVGFDIDRFDEEAVPSAFDCQRRCQENSACHLWTYVFHSRSCFLKSAAAHLGRTTGSTALGKVSGSKWCFHWNTNACAEFDVAYFGYDIESAEGSHAETAAMCQALCEECLECFFWTWDEEHLACHLKSQEALRGRRKDLTTVGKVSGRTDCDLHPPACPEWNVDYNGFDLQKIETGTVPSYLYCQQLCQSSRRCQYWTWVRETQNCYLKNYLAIAGRKEGILGVISGPKVCLSREPCYEVGVGYEGHELANVETGDVDTFELCNSLCKAIPFCFFWTWDGQAKNCHLKHAGAAQGRFQDNTTASLISGPRSCRTHDEKCTEFDVDYRGHTVGSFLAVIPSPSTCRNLCQIHDECRSWTYYIDEKNCFLNDALQIEKVPRAHTVSGARKCSAAALSVTPPEHSWSGDTGTNGSTPACVQVNRAYTNLPAISVVPAATVRECQRSCQSTPLCAVFNYYSSEQTCYLLRLNIGETPFLVYVAFAASGPAYCDVSPASPGPSFPPPSPHTFAEHSYNFSRPLLFPIEEPRISQGSAHLWLSNSSVQSENDADSAPVSAQGETTIEELRDVALGAYAGLPHNSSSPPPSLLDDNMLIHGGAEYSVFNLPLPSITSGRFAVPLPEPNSRQPPTSPRVIIATAFTDEGVDNTIHTPSSRHSSLNSQNAGDKTPISVPGESIVEEHFKVALGTHGAFPHKGSSSSPSPSAYDTLMPPGAIYSGFDVLQPSEDFGSSAASALMTNLEQPPTSPRVTIATALMDEGADNTIHTPSSRHLNQNSENAGDKTPISVPGESIFEEHFKVALGTHGAFPHKGRSSSPSPSAYDTLMPPGAIYSGFDVLQPSEDFGSSAASALITNLEQPPTSPRVTIATALMDEGADNTIHTPSSRHSSLNSQNAGDKTPISVPGESIVEEHFKVALGTHGAFPHKGSSSSPSPSAYDTLMPPGAIYSGFDVLQPSEDFGSSAASALMTNLEQPPTSPRVTIATALMNEGADNTIHTPSSRHSSLNSQNAGDKTPISVPGESIVEEHFKVALGTHGAFPHKGSSSSPSPSADDTLIPAGAIYSGFDVLQPSEDFGSSAASLLIPKLKQPPKSPRVTNSTVVVDEGVDNRSRRRSRRGLASPAGEFALSKSTSTSSEGSGISLMNLQQPGSVQSLTERDLEEPSTKSDPLKDLEVFELTKSSNESDGQMLNVTFPAGEDDERTKAASDPISGCGEVSDEGRQDAVSHTQLPLDSSVSFTRATKNKVRNLLTIASQGPEFALAGFKYAEAPGEHVTSIEACRRLCESRSMRFWFFNRASNSCICRSTAPQDADLVPDSSSFLGTSKVQLFASKHAAYTGEDMLKTKVASFQECQQLCARTENCLSWTFDSEQGSCHLKHKDADKNSRREKDFVSGAKYSILLDMPSYEVDVRYWSSTALKIQDALVSQYDCAKKASMEYPFWSWNQVTKTCVLFKADSIGTAPDSAWESGCYLAGGPDRRVHDPVGRRIDLTVHHSYAAIDAQNAPTCEKLCEKAKCLKASFYEESATCILGNALAITEVDPQSKLYTPSRQVTLFHAVGTGVVHDIQTPPAQEYEVLGINYCIKSCKHAPACVAWDFHLRLSRCRLWAEVRTIKSDDEMLMGSQDLNPSAATDVVRANTGFLLPYGRPTDANSPADCYWRCATNPLCLAAAVMWSEDDPPSLRCFQGPAQAAVHQPGSYMLYIAGKTVTWEKPYIAAGEKTLVDVRTPGQCATACRKEDCAVWWYSIRNCTLVSAMRPPFTAAPDEMTISGNARVSAEAVELLPRKHGRVLADGFTKAKLVLNSVDECEAFCDKYSKCGMWSAVRLNEGEVECRVGSSLAKVVKNPHSVAGVKLSAYLALNLKLRGHVLQTRGTTQKADSPGYDLAVEGRNCAKICKDISACRSWMVFSSTCTLFRRAITAENSETHGALSGNGLDDGGLKYRRVLLEKSLPVEQAKEVRATSAMGCEVQCDNDDQCFQWSWNASATRCLLTDNYVATHVGEEGTVLVTRSDRFFSPFESIGELNAAYFTDASLDVCSCAQMCSSDVRCEGWLVEGTAGCHLFQLFKRDHGVFYGVSGSKEIGSVPDCKAKAGPYIYKKKGALAAKLQRRELRTLSGIIQDCERLAECQGIMLQNDRQFVLLVDRIPPPAEALVAVYMRPPPQNDEG